MEAWVRPTTTKGSRPVIAKEDGPVYALQASGAGRRAGGSVVTGSTVEVGGARLQPNTWQHLALTYDGSLLRIFIDGTLAGSTSTTGPVAGSDGALRIGGIAGEYFAGTLDDVRVYNRALSAAEIVADMSSPVAGAPGNAPPTADIVADCVGLDCTFDGSGSSDGDGSIVDWAWDFGDGTSASGPTVAHSYASDGTFTVRLTVIDDAGGVDIAEREVVVTSSSSPIAPVVTGYKRRGL